MQVVVSKWEPQVSVSQTGPQFPAGRPKIIVNHVIVSKQTSVGVVMGVGSTILCLFNKSPRNPLLFRGSWQFLA